jgi:serine/threonine-protein kinase
MPHEMLIDDRYELRELAGAGGEARVFRARDRKTDRDVAIRFSTDSTRLEKIPGNLHPSWVRWLGAGTDAEKGPYLVLEFLRGETLEQKIGQSPLAPEDWLTFLREASDAVEALHQAGYTHGDLNAQNFLQVEKSSPAWKLLDLPFLRSPAPRAPAFGGIHTLAPEQLESRAPDARSDWYALGCLYYYAATGEYPHAGANAAEIAISLLRFPPAPLREKAGAYPPELADWVMGLLARDPGRREPAISAARRLLAVA